MSNIFLALPTYGTVCTPVITSLLQASNNHNIKIVTRTSSFLPNSFNHLWCQMLNEGRADYFAMLHSDVAPHPGWLDILVEELEKHNLDVLSSVIAIKDEKGVTSTAMFDPERKEDIVHRLTIQESLLLPPVFTEKDVQEKLNIMGHLVVNTGCFIAKEGDWMKQFQGFEMKTIIQYNDAKQKYENHAFSEDWMFSLWAKEHGLKVGAISLTLPVHYGTHGYACAIGENQ